MTSSFLSITSKDVLKGFVVAVLTSIATAVIPVLQTGTPPRLDQLHAVAVAGVAAGVAYLLKNFFTNSEDQLLKKEPTGPVKSGEIPEKSPVLVKTSENKPSEGPESSEPTALSNEAAK